MKPNSLCQDRQYTVASCSVPIENILSKPCERMVRSSYPGSDDLCALRYGSLEQVIAGCSTRICLINKRSEPIFRLRLRYPSEPMPVAQDVKMTPEYLRQVVRMFFTPKE